MRWVFVLALAVAVVPEHAFGWPRLPRRAPVAAPPPAAAAVGPVAGEVRVGPGLTARYEYHFDRNAIRDSRQAGAFFVALTDAGNVLSFTGEPLKLVRELVGPVPATSLGQDEAGAVLVGYRDGRVVRVDPATLASSPVAALRGEIAWIGHRRATASSPGGPVVVVRSTESWTELHDLSGRRVHRLKQLPSAMLLDAQGRFWMGADRGEWGGWCRVLDLRTGEARAVGGDSDHWDGVYGFVEHSGGEVWAYGGVSHMGYNAGYVRRVDNPRLLATFGGGRKGRSHSTTRPNGPITLIARPEALPDSLVVVSYSDVYLTDQEFRAWRKLHTLEVRYRWGRPDAVGAYPSIRALHLSPDGATMLFATTVDGYVRLRSGIEAQLALPGQLGARSIDRIAATSEGPLFIEDELSDKAWKLDEGGWQRANVAPAFEPHWLEPKSIQSRSDWYQTRIVTTPAGEVFTVNESGIRPGTLTTAAWRQGRAVVLGREINSLYLGGTFATPDAQLWNVWYGEIRRFTDGRWRGAGTFDVNPSDPTGMARASNLQVVSEGPPWILLDREQNALLTFAPATEAQGPRLAAVKVTDAGGNPRPVHDAIPWRAGELLIATEAGLSLYKPATGQFAAAPIAAPSDGVTRLYLDRRSRVWLGGRGLWMTEGPGGPPRSLGAVPVLGGSTVTLIAADGDRDGVFVSLAERGILRLHLRRD